MYTIFCRVSNVKLRIMDLLAVNVLVRIKDPLEICRVNELVQIHLQRLRRVLPKYFSPTAEYSRSFISSIYDHDHIRRSLHDQVREGLGFLVHERNAHVKFRLPLIHRNGFLTTGRISAEPQFNSSSGRIFPVFARI